MAEQTLYSLKLNYYYDLNLSRQLLPIARKFLSMDPKLTYTWNYKNTYTDGIGLASEPELKFFVEYVTELASEYIKKENLKLKKSVKFSISIFASEMKEGDQHLSHQHPGSILSGLIYLQVPPNSAKLEFKNPRHNIMWLNFLEPATPESCELPVIHDNSEFNIIVEPSPGLLVMWESWAVHRVPVNHSQEGRITLVFNIGVEDASQ